MRRALLVSLALAALLTSLVGVGGCARAEPAPAENREPAQSSRPRPDLDAQVPAGLQTAVFGLG